MFDTPTVEIQILRTDTLNHVRVSIPVWLYSFVRAFVVAFVVSFLFVKAVNLV